MSWLRNKLVITLRFFIGCWYKIQREKYIVESESLRLARQKIFEKKQNGDSVEARLVTDEQFLDGFYNILTYSKSDEEIILDEKYKNFLNWGGPFVGGVAGRIAGFRLEVYPRGSDHDRHFHVVHPGKGIDTRLSFPDIELQSHKNTRNLIGISQLRLIKEYLDIPSNFERLKNEFVKMGYY